MFYGGRANYEELHREILSLKESKSEIERSRDEALCRSRDLELRYQDLLLELKQLTVTDKNKQADLECQLKVKNYELDRCSLLLGEIEAKYKHECVQHEKLKKKQEALQEELIRLRSYSEKTLCSLKLQLQDKTEKLNSYEKLENELDKIIMRTASLPDEDAETILAMYEKEAFIPLHSKRRLQQSLHLARRILELENYAAELKNDLFNERDLKSELQQELTATKATMLHLDHPTAELIDVVLKRDLEVQKLKGKTIILEQDLLKAKQNEYHLKKELNQLSNHEEQLGLIKKMISDLYQEPSSISPIPVSDRPATTPRHKVYKFKTSYKSPETSHINYNIIKDDQSRIEDNTPVKKKVIHIKKPITFSKVSEASLSRQYS